MPTATVWTAEKLAEEVAGVIRNAAGPLTFAEVKSGLKAAGAKTTGKGNITTGQILAALGTEGVYEYPATTASGKAKYWHKPPLTAGELVARIVHAKLAELGDAPVAAKDLGRSTGRNAAAKDQQKAFDELVAELIAEGKLYRHGVNYGKQKPAPTARELIEPDVLTRIANLGDKPVKAEDIGKPAGRATTPENKAFKEIVAELLRDEKLFAHGKLYGKLPPPPPPVWYKSDTHKKDFAAALKLAKMDGIGLKKLIDALRLELGLDEPEPKPPITPLPRPSIPLRQALKEAYDELCLFEEFSDTLLVELRRIYHKVVERIPQLTVGQFHRELEHLRREGKIELHDLNEVHLAQERELAIERDDRIYYYVYWKPNS